MLIEGFYDMDPSEQKLYIIRQFCADDSSFHNKKKDLQMYGRLIRMNLDTQNKAISFVQDNEISPGTCTKKLIFRNYSSNDPNIYGSHIGYKSIFSFALMEYIEKNRSEIKWSYPEQVDECLDYLQNIGQRFFIRDTIGIRPQYILLPKELQADFPYPDPIQEVTDDVTPAKEIVKEKKKLRAEYNKALEKYFEKSLAHIVGERPAYALSIDGKLIHEIEKIRSCYIDVLYYYMVDKKFPDSKELRHCPLCSADKYLASDIALKQKFYGISNKPFFDNMKEKRSFTAFTACKDCYHQVTVGTSFASSSLNTYLINLRCLVLPELKYQANSKDHTQEIDPEQIKVIPRLLKKQNNQDRRRNLAILRNLQDRFNNFSLFFYYEPSPTSQEFIVNRLIKNISLPSLIEKYENLCSISLENKLHELFDESFSMSFEDLKFMIYPSKQSRPNMKPADFQKINRSMLTLLSSYLYSQPINMIKLLKGFVNVFHGKIQNSNISIYRLDLSPYIMSLYMKHLDNFKLLKGIRKMEEKVMTTTLQNQELLEYFKNHPHVYEENYFAQGLFILGWYLNELEYAQKQKGINRTAVHKLNLRGIPVQKVKSISTVIDDLRLVWEVWSDPVLDAYYRECLCESDMNMPPEEVVFHILSGRSYRKYIGLLKGKEKKEIQDNNDTEMEAQND
jgi:CRISPR-associated protein Csh1